MKIAHRSSHYTRRTSLLVFETEAERQLTDSQLLLICDNLEGIKYNSETQSYDLTGEPFGEARHFGGEVVRDTTDHASVTVYTD